MADMKIPAGSSWTKKPLPGRPSEDTITPTGLRKASNTPVPGPGSGSRDGSSSGLRKASNPPGPVPGPSNLRKDSGTRPIGPHRETRSISEEVAPFHEDFQKNDFDHFQNPEVPVKVVKAKKSFTSLGGLAASIMRKRGESGERAIPPMPEVSKRKFSLQNVFAKKDQAPKSFEEDRSSTPSAPASDINEAVVYKRSPTGMIPSRSSKSGYGRHYQLNTEALSADVTSHYGDIETIETSERSQSRSEEGSIPRLNVDMPPPAVYEGIWSNNSGVGRTLPPFSPTIHSEYAQSSSGYSSEAMPPKNNSFAVDATAASARAATAPNFPSIPMSHNAYQPSSSPSTELAGMETRLHQHIEMCSDRQLKQSNLNTERILDAINDRFDAVDGRLEAISLEISDLRRSINEPSANRMRDSMSPVELPANRSPGSRAGRSPRMTAARGASMRRNPSRRPQRANLFGSVDGMGGSQTLRASPLRGEDGTEGTMGAEAAFIPGEFSNSPEKY